MMAQQLRELVVKSCKAWVEFIDRYSVCAGS